MSENEKTRLEQDVIILRHPAGHTKPEFVYAYYDYCRLSMEMAKTVQRSAKYPAEIKLPLGTKWGLSFYEVEAVLDGNYVGISEKQMREDLASAVREYIFTVLVSEIAMKLGLAYDEVRAWFDTTVSVVIPNEYVEKFYKAVVDVVQ